VLKIEFFRIEYAKLKTENRKRGYKMDRDPRTYKITKNNVELYEAKKAKLPCNDCLVKPTCFKEHKATKKAKCLRYTVELKNPCLEALLIMDLINLSVNKHIINFSEDLSKCDMSILFDNAYKLFKTASDNTLNIIFKIHIDTSYFLFLNVIDRDPKYISNEFENAYVYLGLIFAKFFEDADAGIKLLSKSIELTPESSYSFNARGICYLKKKDLNSGLDDLKKAKIMSGGGDLVLNELIEDVENRINGKRGKSEFDMLYT
jgi:hypothetical protein